jgi:hypothetical protein
MLVSGRGPVHQGQDGGGPSEQLQRLVQQAAVLLDRHKLPSVDAGQAQLPGPVDQKRQASDVLCAAHTQAGQLVGVGQAEQAASSFPSASVRLPAPVSLRPSPSHSTRARSRRTVGAAAAA